MNEPAKPERYLMCPPPHFMVSYVINPWMKGNVGRIDRDLAEKQWNSLYKIISSKADVELMDPSPGLPDMVFTANGGLLLDNDVIIPHFAYHQRQPEEPLFKKWFEDRGYNLHFVPPELIFEGAGDALYDSEGRWLWVGYGHRTSLESHPHLAVILNIKVISLRLVDPRFYHLDTCFVPLPGGYVMYYPEAFDRHSNHQIEEAVPADRRIIIENEDAVSFVANAVFVAGNLIVNRCSGRLCQKLDSLGFKVIQTGLSEFLKAGGGAKCLTLRLNETAPENRTSDSTVSTREVVAEGQLIDSELMGRICDRIVTGGGSFQIRGMHLGQKHNEFSKAEIDVTAPSEAILNRLIQQLLRLGAKLPLGEASDAKMETVTKDGVAPEDFYSTTIYNTLVRVSGNWITVQNQRMDGVIVVSNGSARCELLRNLKTGEMVVTGGEGIREERILTEHSYHERFGFMASGISSERRAELSIERIAWDMNRIRNNGGKIVIVAGPVAVHTGGGEYLAWMVRNGYLNVLLGGNAVAVHDIEQAMFGTSLGIDIQTGRSVEGGHRNHISAINRIRRAGSIEAAVESGDLKSGLFFELVKKEIPYSLAGSIRDDGPLPETQMDMLKAQAEAAKLIKEADIILMLSSMLHAIGIGNMTPAGVKLVCVDINPAVITKLADRGSLESVGIVTDVGLFLSQLVNRLKSFSES